METQIKDSKFKKYFYLAIASVLGVVLFVFLTQLILQLLSVLSGQGILPIAVSPATFELIVSLSNILALCLGAWYGVWLGSYWYEKVYGQAGTGGFVSHVSAKLLQGAPDEDEASWQMDDLVSMPTQQSPAEPSPSVESDEEEPKQKAVVKRTRPAQARTTKVSTPKVQSTTTKKPVPPVKRKTAGRKRPVVS